MAQKTFKPFSGIAALKPMGKGQKQKGFELVQKFLCYFGYLRPKDFTPGRLDKPTQEALKEYQRHHNRRATGTFNKATRKEMITPRCGVRDRPGAMPGARASGRKIDPRTALSVDGSDAGVDCGGSDECQWQKTEIKYWFDNSRPGNGGISPQQCLAEIQKAFKIWEESLTVSGSSKPVLEFISATKRSDADIEFGWRTSGNHSDSDFEKSVVAHADFPGKCGKQKKPMPMHFNGDNNIPWVISKNGGFDIRTVALHEIGHILGLEHSCDADDVMGSKVSKFPKQELEPRDQERIQDLYKVSFPALTVATTDPGTPPNDVIRESILRRIENIEHELEGIKKLVGKLET